MPFGLTLVDGIVALLVLFYVLDDFRRGALFGLLDLTGFLLALLAALLLYGALAGRLVAWVELPYALAKPAAFGLIWITSDLLFGLTLRRLLAGPARAVATSGLGRLLGIPTGLARGLLAAMLGLSVLAALPLAEPVGQAVRDSRVGSELWERSAALQRAMSGVLGDAVQESLALLTVRPESSERVELPFRVQEPRIDEGAEARMLELVNAERTSAGLEPLTLDPEIREVARAYSIEMFQRGFFSHVDLDGESPFDRMREGGVRFLAAGENLALAPRVEVAHEGLMNSPGHRANILNRAFRRVGIGVADGGMHGKMFTQNFAN